MHGQPRSPHCHTVTPSLWRSAAWPAADGEGFQCPLCCCGHELWCICSCCCCCCCCCLKTAWPTGRMAPSTDAVLQQVKVGVQVGRTQGHTEHDRDLRGADTWIGHSITSASATSGVSLWGSSTKTSQLISKKSMEAGLERMKESARPEMVRDVCRTRQTAKP